MIPAAAMRTEHAWCDDGPHDIPAVVDGLRGTTDCLIVDVGQVAPANVSDRRRAS